MPTTFLSYGACLRMRSCVLFVILHALLHPFCFPSPSAGGLPVKSSDRWSSTLNILGPISQ